MKVCHTERLLAKCDVQEFEKWMVGVLDGYKTLALNTETGTFKPHQKYMDISMNSSL
jgi:hypothetical protein